MPLGPIVHVKKISIISRKRTRPAKEFMSLFQRSVHDTVLGDDGSGGGRPVLGLDLSGDPVQVAPALAGQPAPAVGVLLNNLQTLQSLGKILK